MLQPPMFRFGIELELLLEYREQKQYKGWQEFADELSRKLNEVDIDNHVDSNNIKKYSQWAITRDVSIQGSPHQYGVELVSSPYTDITVLTADLTTIFKTITADFSICPSLSCSTHIHISQPEDPFTPESLAALAKATLYFESALDALMPTRTADDEWANPNRSDKNPELAGRTLPQALKKVDEAAAAGKKDTKAPLLPLVRVMNYFSGEHSIWSKQDDKFCGKAYKWNFSRLLPLPPDNEDREVSRVNASKVLGTVEFRQPPGSKSAEEAVAWAVLGVAFVAGAGVVGGGLGGGDGLNDGSLQELWEMLQKGGERAGLKNLEVLEAMFKAAGKSEEEP